MGYIEQKLWHILVKNYGIYYGILSKKNGIYRAKLFDILGKTMGFIGQMLWDIFCKTMGYIGQKLWNILGKNYGIYYGIYCAKSMVYCGQNY